MIKKLIESGKKLTFTGTRTRSPISFSIVNTKDSGRRITLSKGLLNHLDNPNSIDILINEDDTGIIVVQSDEGQHLSKGNVIYNSELIKAITDKFKLDFSIHSSHSFDKISIKTDPDDNTKYAEIILIDK